MLCQLTNSLASLCGGVPCEVVLWGLLAFLIYETCEVGG